MVFLTTTIIFTITFLLFGAVPSYAWGPGTHLEIAREVLTNAALLPMAIKTILEKYPYDFYYGNIGADIVVGKNLTSDLEHCHNWAFGFKLLKKAKSDSQKAFAYGYMSHLAADTIAHNHFIPEKMITTFSTRMHRHIYWELRFDALVEKSVWKIPDEIEEQVHADNDQLLSDTLTGIPLPFDTSKKIFNSFMSVVRVDHWHKMMDMLSENSIWALHKEEKDFFFNLAYQSAMGLLMNSSNAPCVAKDPKGYNNLSTAKEARKKLKIIKNKNGPWAMEMEKILEGISIRV